MNDEMSKMKYRFLIGVSHEIRTPMNAILGITESFVQNKTLPPDVTEAFNKIFSSANSLLRIINDILDLSKIEMGKLHIVPVNYDLNSVICDMAQLNLLYLESKEIKFIIDVDERAPSDCVGDVIRIKQVLNNLLSNAFKYTEKGSVEFSVHSEPPDAKEGETTTLVFRIRDTGKGMSEEEIAESFNGYSRYEEPNAGRRAEGTGLGLSITKLLVDMMEGEITVDSKIGEGTTFTVRIPQKRVGTRNIGREAAWNLRLLKLGTTAQMRTDAVIRVPMPYGSVLVVDDVDTNLYVAEGLLEPYGLKTDTAQSGAEAIRLIEEGNVYDIIFMDHMMPEMNGLDAVKIIRGMGYNRAIVALTANAAPEYKEMFLENGFDDFMAKPIDTRQLNIFLRKFVRAKNKEADISAGNPSKNTQLTEMFVRDAEKLSALITEIHANKYKRKDDLASYVIYIHGLKAALANVGETDLSKIAHRLEMAGREGEIEVITGQTDTFLQMLALIIKRYSPKTTSGGEYAGTDILHKKLTLIGNACEAFDLKTARTALKELKQMNWPANINEGLGEISLHLLSGDFEEVVRIIENMRNQCHKQ